MSEEPLPLGSTAKPEDLYDLIERTCLGRRRLELFGTDRNMRPGWVTVGRALSVSNFKPAAYAAHFRNPDGSVYVTHGGRVRRAAAGRPPICRLAARRRLAAAGPSRRSPPVRLLNLEQSPKPGAVVLVPSSHEIEELRPKSPPPGAGPGASLLL